VASNEPLELLPESGASMTHVPGPEPRPARALLGWLSEKQACGYLHARRRDAELTDAQRRTLEQAHTAVATRPPFEGGSAVLGPCPGELFAHRDALYAHGRFSAKRHEGWEIAMVDLERVCAVQHVVLSHPDPRVEPGIDADDVEALAKITLPIPDPKVLHYQVGGNVAMVSSPNPNLHAVGFRVQQTAQGTLLGFVVEEAASFVQVAEFGGRFVLTDGTHRAASLVRNGITRIPALTRKHAQGEHLAIARSGVLSAATYLGERPALVRDYWDPAVSTAVSMPGKRKLVIIQAIEQSMIDS
jgi:hypothetical protein